MNRMTSRNNRWNYGNILLLVCALLVIIWIYYNTLDGIGGNIRGNGYVMGKGYRSKSKGGSNAMMDREDINQGMVDIEDEERDEDVLVEHEDLISELDEVEKEDDEAVQRERVDQPIMHAPNLIHLGSEYGGWMFNDADVTPSAVIYSVGVGEDITWDEAVMKKYHVPIFGFDPTPKSAAFIKERMSTLPLFHFTEEGLATKQGTLVFSKPKNPDYVSMREGKHEDMGDTVTVKVNTLSNWMEERGHGHVDILKIDIEGSEYDVLEAFLKEKAEGTEFPFTQLLVEFHQRFFPDEEGQERHTKVIQDLVNAGLTNLYAAPNGQEYCFQKK